MKLINGKFYSNENKHVSLCHGDKEQIRLIEMASALHEGILPIQFEEQSIKFYCLCGQLLTSGYNNPTVSCDCGQHYNVNQDFHDLPIIRLGYYSKKTRKIILIEN